ncbi:hypothetical protein J6590_064317 [Homalodisca vitripennis]|nr:hypothetical protein J6590_064317 [Homalodisca vitripennis]
MLREERSTQTRQVLDDESASLHDAENIVIPKTSSSSHSSGTSKGVGRGIIMMSQRNFLNDRSVQLKAADGHGHVPLRSNVT